MHTLTVYDNSFSNSKSWDPEDISGFSKSTEPGSDQFRL